MHAVRAISGYSLRLGQLWVLVVALTACSTVLPSSVLETPPPDPAIAHAMEVREQNGLRADRAWVEAVEADPASVERMGIRLRPAEAAAFDDDQLRQAIEQRAALGLRTDREWVQQVLADPASVERLGIPMSIDEAAVIDRANANSRDVVGVLVAYGDEHAEEWAGVHLDDSGSAVAQVTDHLAAHRAAIAELFFGTPVHVDVRQVRWSVRDLDAFRERIWDPAFQRWLTKRAISLEGVGAPPTLDRVTIRVKSDGPRPGVEQEIIDHLDAADWLVVSSSADWARHLGKGMLTVIVIDGGGHPVTDAMCSLYPDVPGATEAGDEVRDVDEQGRCRWTQPTLGATGYRVEIWRSYQKGFLGAGRGTVPDGGEGQLTIRTAGG